MSLSILKQRCFHAATRMVFLAFSICLGVTHASAQNLPLINEFQVSIPNEGWRGFTDLRFMLESIISLLLATVLAAIIAYHPKSHHSMESIEKAEAPKVYIIYSVIGSLIGIMVVKYGTVVGFVIFGIGGLFRFRTNTGSVTKTGRMIFVTLIGLSAGLNLPHLAILSTIFGFVLIYILDSQLTYRIVVKGLVRENLSNSARIYRKLLESQECYILNENKDFAKLQVEFIFRTSHRDQTNDLEELLENQIPKEFKGSVDWHFG